MIGALLKKIIGTKNDRIIKEISVVLDEINRLEPAMASRTDAELRAKTPEFKERLLKGSSLDDLLPEAFAVVREAARRTVQMRPFDVQIIGGILR